MYDKEKNKWARVGTQARVIRFQPLPDGRILTVNEGEERFRVLKVPSAAATAIVSFGLISSDPSSSCRDASVLESGDARRVVQRVHESAGRVHGRRSHRARCAGGARGLPPSLLALLLVLESFLLICCYFCY